MKIGYSAAESWGEIAENSSLAMAISKLYNAVSNSDIAKFTLNKKLHSLQIPIITQINNIPTISQKVYSGTELSTLPPFNTLYDEGDEKMRNLALLLLDEPNDIIHDFRLNPDSATALLLHAISPTESISQLSAKHGTSITVLIDLAARLIYWRRARAVFPISHRNVYIVSPLAPIAQLYKLEKLFHEKFPDIPSLLILLSSLSSDKPKPFKYVIPSQCRSKADKKKIYINALGWMIRHGIVTLIQTFVMVKIPRSIKMMVNYDIQLEETQRDHGQEQEEKLNIALNTSKIATDNNVSNTAHENYNHSSCKNPETDILFSMSKETSSTFFSDTLNEKNSNQLDYKIPSQAITIPNTITTTINIKGKRQGAFGNNDILLRIPKTTTPEIESSFLKSKNGNQYFQGHSNSFPIDNHFQLHPSGIKNTPKTGDQLIKKNSYGATSSISVINVIGTSADIIQETKKYNLKSQAELSAKNSNRSTTIPKNDCSGSDHLYSFNKDYGILTDDTPAESEATSILPLTTDQSRIVPNNNTVSLPGKGKWNTNHAMRGFKSNSQTSSQVLIGTSEGVNGIIGVGNTSIGSGGSNFRRSIPTTSVITGNTGDDDNNGMVLPEEWTEDTIILEPQSATALQMKWMAKILEQQPPEIVSLFGRLMKYMDGQTAMEWVLMQDNIANKEFNKLVKALEEYLVVIHHW